MTKKSITLDVWQPSDIRVKVNQGEVNSRFLEIKILDKKKSFNLTDKTVIFYATKPDGCVAAQDTSHIKIDQSTLQTCLRAKQTTKNA